MLIYSYVLFRWLKINYPSVWVIKTTVASVLMGIVSMLLIKEINFLVVAICISPLIYVCLHLLFRTLSTQDWLELIDLLPVWVRKQGKRLYSQF